jgi:hypothetical protein
MDGLLSFLTPEQQALADRQARQAMLTQLGVGLLQASTGAPGQRKPSLGQIVGQAGPGAMQAYQGSFDRTLQQIMLQQQMAEQQRQRATQETAAQRQTSIQQAMQLPDMTARIDALRKLGAFSELQAMAGAEKAIRPFARGTGEVGMDNPFAVYQQSEVPGVKKLADQYAKSYQAGNIDDEKANTRLGELARMEETGAYRIESATRATEAAQLAREDRLAAEERARKSREEIFSLSRIDRLDREASDRAEREAKRAEGSDTQRLSSGFAARMETAESIINQLEATQTGLPTTTTSIAASIPFVGGYAQRKVMSPDQQRYKQAADNWIRANLRKESGAVIGADEMQSEYETYFPMPGDSPEVIAQKAAARKVTTDSMRKNAGPAYRPMEGSTLPRSSAVPPGVTVRRTN